VADVGQEAGRADAGHPGFSQRWLASVVGLLMGQSVLASNSKRSWQVREFLKTK